MPPKYKVCYVCGREFGSQSLDIHQKQCLQKREREQALLPRNLRTPLNPQGASLNNEQALESWKNNRKLLKNLCFNVGYVCQQSGSSLSVTGSPLLPTIRTMILHTCSFQKSLVACPNCGRTFLPDRLVIHARSCRPDNAFKRVSGSFSTNGTPIVQTDPSDDTFTTSYSNDYTNTNKRHPSPSITQRQAQDAPAAPLSGRRSSTDLGKGNAGGRTGTRQTSEVGGRPTLADMRPGSGASIEFGRPGPDLSRSGISMGGKAPPNNRMSTDLGRKAGFGGFDQGSSGYNNYEVPTSQMAKMSMSDKSIQPPASRGSVRQSFNADMPRTTNSAPKSGSTKAAPTKPSGHPGRGPPFAGNVGPTVSCRFCGRSFNEDRIEKHEGVCQNITGHTRKAFDSSKARKKGTELEGFKGKASANSRVATAKPAKAAKWRQQHEEFMNALKQQKVIKKIQDAGGDISLLPPPPPSENPDYVQCPHCMRRFNETAAERHIPKCKDTVHKPKPPPSQFKQPLTAVSSQHAPAKPTPQRRPPSSSFGSLPPDDFEYPSPTTTQTTKGTSKTSAYPISSGYNNLASSGASTSYNSANYNSASYSTASIASRDGNLPTKPTTTRTSATRNQPNVAPAPNGRTITATLNGSGARTVAPDSGKKAQNFCGFCGTRFESDRQRFCGECGESRI